jgi:hypothetical protein
MLKNAGISGELAPREDAEPMPTMFITVGSIEDYM